MDREAAVDACRRGVMVGDARNIIDIEKQPSNQDK